MLGLNLLIFGPKLDVWIEDGSRMDRGWIEYGSMMDRGWIEVGSRMDPRMDRGWIEDGSRLDGFDEKLQTLPTPCTLGCMGLNSGA